MNQAETPENASEAWSAYKKPPNVFVSYSKGKRYCYFRRRGAPLINLPNLPYTHPDFLAAYLAAADATGMNVPSTHPAKAAQMAAEADAMVAALELATRKAKSRAQEKDLACNLTTEMVMELFKAQGGKCAMTGIPFSVKNESESRRNPFAPSVDRVDLTLGYIRGNVRIVTTIANCARSDFGDAVFYSMCMAAATEHKKKMRA